MLSEILAAQIVGTDFLAGVGVFILSVLGTGGLATAIVVKMFNKKIDNAVISKTGAETDHIEAETHKASQQLVSGAVDMVTAAMDEVRKASAEKTEELAALRVEVDALKEFRRKKEASDAQKDVALAYHDAWDKRAHEAIIQIDPRFPAPPPLRPQPLV